MFLKECIKEYFQFCNRRFTLFQKKRCWTDDSESTKIRCD